MDDAHVVQTLETLHHLAEVAPDQRLRQERSLLAAFLYFVVEVATPQELHHYAEVAVQTVYEGLLVGYDVGVIDGGQYPDFVEGVFFFLFLEAPDLDFLKCVGLPIRNSGHFVDYAERSLSQLVDNLEVLQGGLFSLQ